MLYQWLRSGADAGSRGYDLEQIQLSLTEPIDVPLFARAWTSVARRHIALCAQFSLLPGQEPFQQFDESVVVPVTHEDWRRLTLPDANARLLECLREDRRQGFDLGLAPLMRVKVLSLCDGRTEVLWSVHHILLDGRSFPTILGEVFQLYEAERDAVSIELPATSPDEYRAHLLWAALPESDASRTLFAASLASLTGPTPLPLADGPYRSTLPGYETREQIVPEPVTTGLQALARSTEVALSDVIHAAWAIVLSRMVRLDDVLFGTTRRCQRQTEKRGGSTLVGMFMNTLPLRVVLSDSVSVSDLLRQVSASRRALRDHATTGATNACAAAPALHGAPPFETLVTFDSSELNASLAQGYGNQWKTRSCTLHEQPAIPLNAIVRHGESLSVSILLDRSRFREGACAQILTTLTFVLEQLGLRVPRLVRDIEAVPPAQATQLLQTWNATARTFPDQLLIHELFEARVASQPEATAVECDGVALSYRELEEQANRLAHHLRAGGAGPGTFIGVCLERGLQLVVALMGVLKSGAAYVPLDPTLPKARLNFICDDSNVVLVITQERLESLFECPLLSLDHDVEVLTRNPLERPSRNIEPDATCYVIFTSGTTGEPNGVVLSHRAIVNTLHWVNRTFEVSAADRLLFVTPPSFDLSVYDVFGVLAAGGTVVVANDALLADPERLAASIVEQRITLWDSAPAALQRLASFLPTSAPAALRLVLLSGDWIPLTLPDLMRRHFLGVRVVSLGGATEAAIWSNWYPIDRLDSTWSSIPYGRPIQNARYHVLDEQKRIVPVGTAGDLYIGGVCLAEGYLNRPELSRARFVPDPFRTGERLYKTGDLARYFPDGNLEFLGRSDFQVKIRGVRVELGEIEAALLDLPEIQDAICAAQVDASGEKSVVAYVVRTRAPFTDEARVKAALSTRLPRPLVPSRVVFLPALPLSANGKVDRKALQKLPQVETHPAARVEPRSRAEHELVQLWETLLQRKGVGVSDDFFALGGHSLLVLALVSRAKVRLDLNISIPRFLEEPTIEGILRRAKWTARWEKLSQRITRFRGGGARAPLLIVAGEPAYFALYRELANCLSFERDVLLCEEMSGDEAAFTVEELAAMLVEQISPARHAVSAFLVVGIGTGASVAFESAKHLERAGIRIPLLTLVAPSPQPVHGARDDQRKAQGPRGFSPRLALLGHVLRNKLLHACSKRRAYQRNGILNADLLLVSAPADPALQSQGDTDDDASSVRDWRPLVSGGVSVLSVRGDHMSFLSNGESERIRSQISVHLNESGAVPP